MRNRKSFLILTIVALLLLALFGSTLGAMALTHSGWIGNGWNQMMGTQQDYPGMMGTQPGYPGMMGGNQSTTPQQGTPGAGVMQVNMHNSAYQPANIKVHVGTTVTWTNQDTMPHTVTFRSSMNGRSMMGSSMMQRGQSFSFTFRIPGTYQYYCTVHPSMVATVTVVS